MTRGDSLAPCWRAVAAACLNCRFRGDWVGLRQLQHQLAHDPMEFGLEPSLAGFFHAVQRVCNYLQTLLHCAQTGVRLSLQAEEIRFIETSPGGAPSRKALPKLREPCLRFPRLSQSPTPDYRGGREEMRKTLFGRELNQCFRSVLRLTPRQTILLEERREQKGGRTPPC
ncbi:hypothetical protein AB7M69_003261 [Bradyrhizobium japonicum]